ncbi:MAG TPA: hypothetical protein VHP31_08520 [Caproicibacter sp.]|nr:hypothetical protein [Caproicibacter sp.]
MTRRGQAEAMLNRYGEPVTFGGAQFNAIIQPLQFKNGNGRNLLDEFQDAVRYLYTGPAAHKLSVGGTVAASQRNYAVKRCDTVLLGGEELYVRAVLAPLSPSADTEVRLEQNGTVFARADSYTAKAVQNADALFPWGESEPAAIAQGTVRWELALTGVQAESGADLFTADPFSVIITRGGEKITYSGCRWKTIQNTGGPAVERSANLEILAAARTAEKEATSNGTKS